MVTILKFPIYLQIETGNVDRSLISKLVKERFHPLLLSYLATAGIKRTVLDELSFALKSPVSVSILTELDLINKAVSKEVPSLHNVI